MYARIQRRKSIAYSAAAEGYLYPWDLKESISFQSDHFFLRTKVTPNDGVESSFDQQDSCSLPQGRVLILSKLELTNAVFSL